MNSLMRYLFPVFGLTVRAYRSGHLEAVVGTRFTPDPVTPYLDAILAVRASAAQISTRSLHCDGTIRADDGTVYVAGPAVRMRPEDVELKEITLELNVPPERQAALSAYLDTLPVIPLNKFAELLCMMNAALNHTEVRPENVLPGDWPAIPDAEET